MISQRLKEVLCSKLMMSDEDADEYCKEVCQVKNRPGAGNMAQNRVYHVYPIGCIAQTGRNHYITKSISLDDAYCECYLQDY